MTSEIKFKLVLVPLEIDIGSGEGAEELDIGSNSSSVMIIDFSDGLNKKHEPEIIDDRDLEIANGILKPIDNMNNENNGLNPSFVLVDHELEVPDGIEGPKEVYVTPDNPSFYQNVSFDLSVNRELEATYTTPKFIQRSEDETFDEPQRVIPLQVSILILSFYLISVESNENFQFTESLTSTYRK